MGTIESAAAIVNALIEIGLDRLVGSKPAFVNVSTELLHGNMLDALPADKVVLEILEDTEPTPQVMQALEILSLQGYTFAIDDYTFQPELEPFLPFASIIKLDVAAIDTRIMARQLPALSKSGKKLLAEKVESHETFEACRACGFDYYQGYFFARPTVLRGKGIPSNRAALLSLMYKLQQPDVDLREIERIIAADVALSYKLFRLVRSALIAGPSTINSISQAVMFLGLKATAAVASLLALSSVEDKPSELLVLALVRARMCELLAGPGADAQEYFTVGLFSVLDAFLEASMEEIAQELPLAPEVRNALVDPMATGTLASALQCVKSYERGDWTSVGASAFVVEQLEAAYLDAVRWSDQTTQALLEPPNRGEAAA